MRKRDRQRRMTAKAMKPKPKAAPRPKPARDVREAFLYRWTLPRQSIRHRIVANSRTTCVEMVDQMAYLMTGREIAQAVCRQLRLRKFPEADAPSPRSNEP